MSFFRHEQYIQAPNDICFDLARNVEIHTKTTSHTKEEAVGGMTTGLLEAGELAAY